MEEQIESDIKNTNKKETFIANIGFLFDVVFMGLLLILGLNIITKITDPTLNLFGLLGFIYVFLRLYRTNNFVIVYNSKSGGLIRYN